MSNEYYWELNVEKGAFQTIGPKRTLEFFLDAVKKGRRHILDLYNPDSIMDVELYKKALRVIKTFRLCDSELELTLAQILTNFVKFPETDKNRIMTIYLVDLLGRFIFNSEKDDSFTERVYEYASFRASADFITVTYGIWSTPELDLTKAEAATLGKDFARDKRGMTVDDILRNGKSSYEHAAGTAQQILDTDFFRLTDNAKRIWEKRVKLNNRLSKKYHECLEILRTAKYKFFH